MNRAATWARILTICIGTINFWICRKVKDSTHKSGKNLVTLHCFSRSIKESAGYIDPGEVNKSGGICLSDQRLLNPTTERLDDWKELSVWNIRQPTKSASPIGRRALTKIASSYCSL